MMYNPFLTTTKNVKRPLLILLMLLPLLATPTISRASTDDAPIAEQVMGTDTSSTGFVAKALRWYDAHMNYGAVGALMTVESSFVPFPSEVVIPPAVYVACNPQSASGMKIWIIVLIGTLGALLGGYINYFLARWLGRPIIYAFADSKLGHMLLLSGAKVERAEEYFNRHGNISTLIGRMVPVVRQLISIPAGLSKMNIGSFTLFTCLGALLWNCILALLGYLAYQAADPSVIEHYSHLISIILVAVLVTAIALLVVRQMLRRKKKTQTQQTGEQEK